MKPNVAKVGMRVRVHTDPEDPDTAGGEVIAVIGGVPGIVAESVIVNLDDPRAPRAISFNPAQLERETAGVTAG